MIKKEYRDEKAVRSAINRLCDGEFRIIGDGSEEPAEAETENA